MGLGFLMKGNSIYQDCETSASAPKAFNMRFSQHEPSHFVGGPVPTCNTQPTGNEERHLLSRLENDARINASLPKVSVCSDLRLEEEGLDIPWSELDLKEAIGEGMCFYLKNIPILGIVNHIGYPYYFHEMQHTYLNVLKWNL